MVARSNTDVSNPRQWERDDLSDTVALSEIVGTGLRFEAATYNIAARRARERLADSGYRLRCLFGAGGLCKEAHNAFRFRRIFVDESNGVPFLTSSEINSIRPRVERWLSRKLTRRLEHLLIRRNDVLISCSGSIGNIGFAGRRIEGMALSQDAIRVRFDSDEAAGYVAAFLRTSFGRLQLQSVTYGSVIVHIEPEHPSHVQVPELGAGTVRAIGRVMLEATEKRDEANDLIDAAITTMESATTMSPFFSLEDDRVLISNSVLLSELNGRFEGAFHDRVTRALESALSESPVGVATLGDPMFLSLIRPITKFRKRTYVEDGGIPLLSSKQLFQVDPIGVKRLARGAHAKDLVEIALNPFMLIVTRSGTIGRVQIIPEYMNGWTASEHATRLVAVDRVKAAYLFAWLSSSFGQRLIRRHAYGSVVQEIDKDMIGSIPVPIVSQSVERQVAGPVLQANRLRDEAWRMEEAALRELVERIENKGPRRTR